MVTDKLMISHGATGKLSKKGHDRRSEEVLWSAFWYSKGKVSTCNNSSYHLYSITCTRFDISAVHPQSKMPGTYTEVPYCKKATTKEVRPQQQKK